MHSLAGKRIVLGVSGGIAAYKAAALTSKLTQAGAIVNVVMTNNALQFVQPATFQALSHQPVHTNTFQEPDPHVISHIDLADKADLVLVAPATANIIGKMANGIADDMLTTTLLATKAPVMVAPAMNVNMYDHPAVRANMERLAEYGYRFVEPGVGLLACGWIGKGRLAEPEEIVEAVASFFAEQQAAKSRTQDLQGKRVLVTAGPTREKIDPVRYITNHASGKMGYAIAEAARDRGAKVVLVSGPTALARPSGIQFVAVESVQEMFDAVMEHLPDSDIVVKSAAVSDYRPKTVQEHKMKKGDGPLILELDKAPDILRTIGERKTKQFVVGFAAETQDVLQHAQSKLEKKNLDMIVANNVLTEGAGMGSDTNIVTLLTRAGEQVELDKLSKRDVADKLFDAVLLQLSKRPLSELS
ncbi:bifunctional phosphopantothenoylcysteine decarboxylase/phosphopantothenate--cysteine ligase CoaBC [Brevibacillus choshinensis]|uniref:bifunctional phosphopantothenoylcysteine decarboxylase/phosphopantothenate--cysteine ligase CoaBC n=1 Tax=Brevibacillus choshinensis TaxID=54911 RepID=UPI002E1B1817|nr:bifunctional phosphopantothenoylcysteine decarboxylase/phosphopantothenate--cysteine ligase CoaBC [Brevibacillus choshinensis]MED4581796.1 bifunctional phosphopantothenoylcysteine decarboxylase/phosphopantothenate--cysteine ligase CoaBC [Brevibacillus choshinensis]MED4749869.1 bifunctional phosphopantothenoylcysteine decarboxylase/phosphopantothenate--cysteine ligase CoaBC [Brevibacillus choshinensis]MED4780535.1 bifunctional phosphopantothenoylcysteine decarboxylase/phosphopantothenate--cyst